MTKIIKEMLPPDVRVARDTQDLLIECCVGEYIRSNFYCLDVILSYSLIECPHLHSYVTVLMLVKLGILFE